MKKLLFIIFLFALIGCKTKQTIEQEKVQTESSISKSTKVDDSSIITIVYDMLDDFDATREIGKPGTNDTANSPKPPNRNRHRKGKIVISKTAKSAKSEITDSTAVSIYHKTPKKVAKHVNNCTLLPWAIIAILILILVICVKYRVLQQKISNKIRHGTE
jgi:hypothetical protein